MANKKLEVLVIEDDEKNLENCKKAYQPLVEKGLVAPIYVTNGDEAEKYIEDKVDAGILDLYFPGSNAREKIEEFAKKYGGPEPEAVLANGLYPLGIYYADKLAEKNKPIIFVSTIATGHAVKTSPFYELRKALTKDPTRIQNPKLNYIVYRAWKACESQANSGAIITQTFDLYGGTFSDKIEKTEKGWLVALKAISKITNTKDAYNAIPLKDLVGDEYLMKDIEKCLEEDWQYYTKEELVEKGESFRKA